MGKRDPREKRAEKPAHQAKLEQELLEIIRKKNKDLLRGVEFSNYTNITLKDNTIEIYITSRVIRDKKHEYKDYLKNPITDNMQSDSTAFEGWAVCLKTWLAPEKDIKVKLKWDEPITEQLDDKSILHYHRFLYRVMKFIEFYEWFSVDSVNKDAINKFIKVWSDNNFTINFSSDRKNKKERKDKISENNIEYDIVKVPDNYKTFLKEFDIDFIDRQFPVGVKEIENGKSFFVGGGAAIDLYGMNEINKNITIFELKYSDSSKKNKKNKKIGIISELFFYCNIIRDVIKEKIKKPSSLIIPNQQKVYNSELTGIKGIFLANEFHPLVSSDVIITLNAYGIVDVPIEFKRVPYTADLTNPKKILIKCKL